jgi:hypothetical protein
MAPNAAIGISDRPLMAMLFERLLPLPSMRSTTAIRHSLQVLVRARPVTPLLLILCMMMHCFPSILTAFWAAVGALSLADGRQDLSDKILD